MAHGHDDHAHAASAATSHGPIELPPVPSVRSISPAREDYERPWPGRLIIAPFAWAAVALLLFAAARSWGRPIGEYDAEEERAAASEKSEKSPEGDGAHPTETPSMAEAPAK